MSLRGLIFTAVSGFWAWHSLSAGQESNRFRGADGSGSYTAPGLPVTWTDDDYRWKKALPGNGHSSPIVWDEQLYLTCGDGDNAGNFLLCLDKKTGEEKWRLHFESEHRRLHRLNTFASSTPAVDPHHVYVAWSDNEHFRIAAVSHDGRGVWERDLGAHHTQHGGGTSPIVYRDKVYIANDSRGPSAIHALDRMTGETAWKVNRPWDPKGKTSYSTPLVYRPETGEPYLIFNSTSSGMTAVDPDSGKTLWQIADLFPKRTILSPFTAKGLIFGSCGDGNIGFFLAAIRPPRKPGEAPAEAYRIRKSAPYVPTPVAFGNRLFLVSDGGSASCIDAASGEEIWKDKLGDTYYSSPIRVDDRIYAVSQRADVVVFRAADHFEILGRTLIDEETNATPIVDEGRLYLRTVENLYCLE